MGLFGVWDGIGGDIIDAWVRSAFAGGRDCAAAVVFEDAQTTETLGDVVNDGELEDGETADTDSVESGETADTTGGGEDAESA